MRVLVLGASAGGGLPQWNCGCRNCNDARTGRLAPQTQSSLAVTNDGHSWTVFNASPDIRGQLSSNQHLWPTDLRQSPLKSLILTNADIDHIGGLLTLREKQSFSLFLTAQLDEILRSNTIFQALDSQLVSKCICKLNEWFDVDAGARARLFAVPGKVPLFLEDACVDTQLIGEQTVGIEYEANGSKLVYIPGCAAVTTDIESIVSDADLLFFDGTLFTDDEMIVAGLSNKTGARMGHMSISGPSGSLEALRQFASLRKIYIHMNNTNPVWSPDSSERKFVQSNGWDVGFDGMEITL